MYSVGLGGGLVCMTVSSCQAVIRYRDQSVRKQLNKWNGWTQH